MDLFDYYLAVTEKVDNKEDKDAETDLERITSEKTGDFSSHHHHHQSSFRYIVHISRILHH